MDSWPLLDRAILGLVYSHRQLLFSEDPCLCTSDRLLESVARSAPLLFAERIPTPMNVVSEQTFTSCVRVDLGRSSLTYHIAFDSNCVVVGWITDGRATVFNDQESVDDRPRTDTFELFELTNLLL